MRVPIPRLCHLAQHPEDATPEEIRAIADEALWARAASAVVMPVDVPAFTATPIDLSGSTTTLGGDPVPAKLPFTVTAILFYGEACHRCGGLSVTGHGAEARCLTCGSAP